MINMIAAVKEFHLATDTPAPETMQYPGDARVNLRKALLKEEHREVQEAIDTDDPALIVGELADLIYVSIGTALEYGLPIDRAFSAVHSANMAKVDPETGKVRKREDGKVLKPDGWKPADMAAVLAGDIPLEQNSALAEIAKIQARFLEINAILGEGPREDWMRPLEDEFTFLRGRLSVFRSATPPPIPQVIGGDLAQAGRDIRILLTQVDWLEELTGEKLGDEDAALVAQIRQSWAAATDATQLQHVLSVTQHPNVESPNREQSGIEAAIQHVTVTDFATRLFDLHGFMLLETYRDKPAVTVTFPDLKQAQQFHDALVELSTHRPRPRSLLEGSDNG